MENILKYFKKFNQSKFPKETQEWLRRNNIAESRFFPIGQRRVEELFEQGFFKGQILNQTFNLELSPYLMNWKIGQLPEIGQELILQAPYQLGKQKECGVFELQKDGVTLFQSDQTVGEERRVYQLNNLIDEIGHAIKTFPSADHIHIWHSHPFMEGIGMGTNRIAVKIHPLSPSDIRTCIEVNRSFKTKTTVHAVTKSSSHYQFLSNYF